MLSKEEITQWLLKNCIDENGDLNLSCLDFSNFDGNVDVSRMKVKKSLCQYCQEVGGFLIQNHQKVKGTLMQYDQEVGKNLFQNSQKVEGYLRQDYQEVRGDIYQNRQKAKGRIYQD